MALIVKKVTYLCDFRMNVIYIFKKLQTSVTPGWGAPGLEQVTTQGDNKDHLWMIARIFVMSVVHKDIAKIATTHLKAGL